MSENTHAQVPIEPERYELKAAPPYRFDLDRRDFFKFLGGGLLVVSILKPAMVATVRTFFVSNTRRGASTLSTVKFGIALSA